jgi:hypothetical protein
MFMWKQGEKPSDLTHSERDYSSAKKLPVFSECRISPWRLVSSCKATSFETQNTWIFCHFRMSAMSSFYYAHALSFPNTHPSPTTTSTRHEQSPRKDSQRSALQLSSHTLSQTVRHVFWFTFLEHLCTLPRFVRHCHQLFVLTSDLAHREVRKPSLEHEKLLIERLNRTESEVHSRLEFPKENLHSNNLQRLWKLQV